MCSVGTFIMVVGSIPIPSVLRNVPVDGVCNSSSELSRKFNPQSTYGHAYFLIDRPLLQDTDSPVTRGQRMHYP